MDAVKLYGLSMTQMLPYDEIEKWCGHPDLYMNKIEELIITSDDNDIGGFVEIALKYPDAIKETTKKFHFAPETKIIDKDKIIHYLKYIKAKNYTKTKKLICNWSDRKERLIDYRMLKFYVGYGLIVEKFHKINSFKQKKWLEKCISFITQKQNRAKYHFERDFFKLLLITS